MNGLDSAVERARVFEYLQRGSIFCALIQETYLICGTGLRHLLVGYLLVTLHSQCFFFNIHRNDLFCFFSFSLPLSLPFGRTFEVLSMCLLFCFVCFERMLCCDVVC